MYTVRAYDQEHNELWIAAGSAHLNAVPHITTDRVAHVVGTYETVKTGKIIDPDTGLPTIRTRDPKTGRWTKGKRRIAYFRTTNSGGYCFEIYFTKHGRQAGVRNYQARRATDAPGVRILGHQPIHTAPRMERCPGFQTGYYTYVVGEGNPYGRDDSSDEGTIIAEAVRCTRVNCGFSGWEFTEYYARGGPSKLLGGTLHTLRAAFAEAGVRYNNR